MSSANDGSKSNSDDLLEEGIFEEEELSSSEHASQHKDQLSEELVNEDQYERNNTTWKDKLSALLEFFSKHFLKLLFAISLMFVYLEYDQTLKQQRISNSFEMVKDWEKQGAANDYVNFSKRVENLSDKASIALGEIDSQNDKSILISNYVRRNMFKDISSKDNEAIDRVLYYFNKVGLCIDAELCEKEYLVEFFGDSVKRFWFYYRDNAIYKRTKLKQTNHAEYTERFVQAAE